MLGQCVFMEMEDLQIPLPVLDGKNFRRWALMMRPIFVFHEVLEIVQEEISDVEENASKEKDCLALTIIQQSVNSEFLEKIGAAQSAKEAWEILNKAHGGAGKEKCRSKRHPRRGNQNRDSSTGEVKKNEGRTLRDQPQRQLVDQNLTQPQVDSRPTQNQEEAGSTQQILGEVKKNSPTEKRSARTEERSAQDPEPVCEEEPPKSDDVVVETVIDREPRAEDKQCFNLGEFSETRVLGKQSPTSDDEPNATPTEHNQTSQLQEPQFSNLGKFPEIRILGIRISQEEKGFCELGKRLCHGVAARKVKSNREGDESSGIRVLRIGVARMKATSLSVRAMETKPESVRTAGKILNEAGACVCSFAESVKMKKSHNENEDPVGLDAVTETRMEARSRRTRASRGGKKQDRDGRKELSVRFMCKNKRFCAKMLEIRSIQLGLLSAATKPYFSDKKKGSHAATERKKRSAREREKRTAREKKGSGVRKLGLGRWRPTLGQVGLAQFLQHSGQWFILMGQAHCLNKFDGSSGHSGAAESHMILGQSGVDQVQCLQSSEWVNVGLIFKPWDPGTIFVVPN